MSQERSEREVTRDIEKLMKTKKKNSEKSKESPMGTQDAGNISAVKPIEHVPLSGKEDTFEKLRNHKKSKKKKNKESEVAGTDVNDCSENGTDEQGENGSGDAVMNHGKKKKKSKGKNLELNKTEMSNSNEVEGNQSANKVGSESNFTVRSSEGAKVEKKKKRSKRKHDNQDLEKGEKYRKEFGQHSPNSDVKATEILNPETQGMEDAKKERKKKLKRKHNERDFEREGEKHRKESGQHSQNSEVEAMEKVERKKRKKEQKDSKDDNWLPETSCKNKGKKNKTQLVENGPIDNTPSKSNKRVTFSNQVEVFPPQGNSNPAKENVNGNDLVRGKRFTPEEDEIVKDAVNDYIRSHDLGDEGLEMVLDCKKNPKVRGCWKEIGSAIPYRPYTAVYYRAQILFRRSENRKWTEEEYEEVLKFTEKNGKQWRKLADELGKHRFHVKDTWRRIKLTNHKKGHWSQEEYQKLFDLVNVDLQAKLQEEKPSKHGMLRDNICWTAISDELLTRSSSRCCLKWYDQLTSSMVAEGVWSDSDDYRLIAGLYRMDATCMEDVDWDDVVEGRSGDVCQKRWNQMVKHLGRNGHKPFAEQVEVLAQRYCPHLLETREAWDSKPRVE